MIGWTETVVCLTQLLLALESPLLAPLPSSASGDALRLTQSLELDHHGSVCVIVNATDPPPPRGGGQILNSAPLETEWYFFLTTTAYPLTYLYKIYHFVLTIFTCTVQRH